MRALLLSIALLTACTRDVPVADEPRSCCAFPTGLTAKVVRKDGSPVAGVQVEFRSGGTEPRWLDITDEQGIASVAPGIIGTFHVEVIDAEKRWILSPDRHIVTLTQTESPSVQFVLEQRGPTGTGG